ncbi:helicase-related protein [Capnocytophaga sp. oral taxon 338]|uniref:helicase-related protein n=1 Tax=Capnocytophaga sp. oral taxon 338 TaxID=710239 RepID=UPI000202F141|nr:helicase-related protein [Capnocytophaga sp. oral taxon 338]EGD33588.1 ATP-dependent helicase HEPA [Capnocytophaga sp. oral taxon 338 str. F0234]
MLVDNHSKSKKVYNWIEENLTFSSSGDFSIVTGFFTIGALLYFVKITNDKIAQYRIILGDITQRDTIEISSLDLLNADLSLEKALKLKSLAKEAVAFLKLDKVALKTLEPNFCHAKVYIHKTHDKELVEHKNFFLSGSSNLTEAGIGLKTSDNFELNIGGLGDTQYEAILDWFNALWEHPKAHTEKYLTDEQGKETKVDFKEYLIQEIAKLFKDFLPKDIYYKILFEYFAKDVQLSINNPDLARSIDRLKSSEIYNALYEFQQKGAESLIRKLEQFKGAILADAVGLGKTWTALAVMKFYQNRDYDVVLFCPKKLHYNWLKYKVRHNSRFEADRLNFAIRFHTDLDENLMQKPHYKEDRQDYNFVNNTPKLIVIDESHNLRNDKSKRFQYLLEEIIKKNKEVKILLLSATPINNSFKDIRNQIKLLTKDNNAAFKESLDIENLYYLFNKTTNHFNRWQEKKNAPITELTRSFDPFFYKLTDSLIVARTRKMIIGQQHNLSFPIKAKPQNKYITPKIMLEVDSLDELIHKFPPILSGYQPNYYTLTSDERTQRRRDEKKGVYSGENILEDDVARDRFLVKMMYILLLKRLESSWYSFHTTVNKILQHHQNVLSKIENYQKYKSCETLSQNSMFTDDEEEDLQEYTIGKREIKLSDIENAGNLTLFEKSLKRDISKLKGLSKGMDYFSEVIAQELEDDNLSKSSDTKLQELIKVLQQKSEYSHNPKVIIFTTYRDTAQYLFDQLSARGFSKIAMISGEGAITDYNGELVKNFEPILERFAPFTKLFTERKWEEFSSDIQDPIKRFEAWKEWVVTIDKKVEQQLQTPIDILIATDALSEGQNLQDADMVINYDIHWNPVRAIQRVGRIDRIGSPNQQVYTVNFWPAPNINDYLNLQTRIEKRMAAMKVVGSEDIKDFTENYAEIATDETLEERQNRKMLEQMQESIDDLEDEKSFGFDDLSLENFRQDLALELDQRRRYYEQLPNGIFSGIALSSTDEPQAKEGIIALIGSPVRKAKERKDYKHLRLIYIDSQGTEVFLNESEILNYLAKIKNAPRYGCEKLDIGEEEVVKHYANALSKWFEQQQALVVVDGEGHTKKVAGKASLDMLDQLSKGRKNAIEGMKNTQTMGTKYNKDNWDLITWLIVKK